MVRMTSHTTTVNLTGGSPQNITFSRSDFGFTDEEVILAFPRVGNSNGLYEDVTSSYSFFEGTTNSNVCITRLYSPTNANNVPVTVIVLYRNKA